MAINRKVLTGMLITMVIGASNSHADENLFGYIRGAETLPKGAMEFDQTFTYRDDKGIGTYHAWDSRSEIEYGVTDRFTFSGYLKSQAIDTQGILIDAYIPGDKDYGLRPSGVEAEFKYNFLSPAKDDFGLAGILELGYNWLDKHSGQDKDSYFVETTLAAQKYFMEGQMVWAGNLGIEATYAIRHEIDNLPAGFEWPDQPEMEIELTAGTGLSYRFAPNWFVGGEVQYQTEFETSVGQERWSVFAGPNIHYGGEQFWATLTWFPQIVGGGPGYPGQTDTNLHLIEKTKQEVRFKFGIDF